MTDQLHRSPDLSTLGAGFSDVAHGSQAVFRSVLQALSHPGRQVAVSSDAEVPPALVASGQATSASVLLALLDAETTVWLSPSLVAGGAGTWLRFHTGCTMVADAALAQFVWAASLDELPALASLNLGTDASPELAATCVVGVPSLAPATPAPGAAAAECTSWVLEGPGIAQTHTLHVSGISTDERDRLQRLREANHGLFPRGVDVLLATPTHVAGLPRTTRLTPLFGPLPAQGD